MGWTLRHTRCGQILYTARIVTELEPFGHRLNIHPAVNKRTRNRKRSRRRRRPFVGRRSLPVLDRRFPHVLRQASCAPRVLRPAPASSPRRSPASEDLDAGHGRWDAMRHKNTQPGRRETGSAQTCLWAKACIVAPAVRRRDSRASRMQSGAHAVRWPSAPTGHLAQRGSGRVGFARTCSFH